MDVNLRSREITTKSVDSVALIVAYRRHDNLEKLLKICLSNDVRRIYIALDAAANIDAEADVEKCKRVIESYKKGYPDVVHSKLASKNLGCAVSVLTACDWVFEQETFVSILEDDCLPVPSFFNYMADCALEMHRDSNIFLACGSQFAPTSIVNGKWHLSDYPLIWGWGTSRERWMEIKRNFVDLKFKSIEFKSFCNSDYAYWQAGAVRALKGYVDVWDTPLVYLILERKGKVILPPENLIQNVGFDHAATHTTSSSNWINYQTGSYTSTKITPEDAPAVDSWLRGNLFGISKRHIFTTRIRWLLDTFHVHKRVRDPLLKRWKNI